MAQNGSDRREEERPPLRVLTLNVWGLKYIAQHRTERLRAIAERIIHPTSSSSVSSLSSSSLSSTQSNQQPQPGPPDIVALQELFTYADYSLLRRLTHDLLPYGAFYHNGAFGAGLVILSRWLIEEKRMEGYILNGRPSAFWRGDWYVGKGVACARVKLPGDRDASSGSSRSGYLQIFNTHLHAPYGEGTHKDGSRRDSYACHRACQAWQIGGMMRRAMERGDVVVGCGDFNMVVSGLEYRVIQHRTRGRLRDVWRQLHPDSLLEAWDDAPAREGPPPTIQQSLRMHGHTCDSVANTWRWSKSHQKDLRHGRDRAIGADEADPKARRLDYIFLGDGVRVGMDTHTDVLGGWRPISARVSMTQRHPTLKCSLSDHFGVEAELAWSASPSQPIRQRPSPSPSPSRAEEIEEENSIAKDATLEAVFDLLKNYTKTTLQHRRLRLLHFFLSVLLSVACHIVIWFVPASTGSTTTTTIPYPAFLLMLFSTLNLAAGVVDGLIGLLFCGSELRSLKMFEDQVQSEMGISAGNGKVRREGGEDGDGLELVLAREKVVDLWG